MKLKDQVCIITGGGSGIGRDAAIKMAQEGATVVIIGRTESKLDAVKAEVDAAGGKAMSWTRLMSLTTMQFNRWQTM